MSTEQQRDPARSFGGVADAYDRGRPTYPREAAVWLTSEKPLSVLELGAGTGKLTEQLVALGHDVHATEPDPKMLAILDRNLPDVRLSRAPAEEIPAGDASYDVVVSAQAFHWFDPDRALPEIARVLKPHGRLSLVWNQRDERKSPRYQRAKFMPAANMIRIRIHCDHAPNGSSERGSGEKPPVAIAVNVWQTAL